MNYFHGAGVQGGLHPSLKAYMDCFMSPPFPKAFPRGGGVWDQDPILMRHFRIIRDFELEWKEVQSAATATQSAASGQGGGGGIAGIGDALNQYIETLEEQGTY